MPAQCTTKPLEYEGCDPPGARASRPQPYSCKPPAIQGHSLVKRTKPPGSAGVPPATLFLQAACDPGPLPRTVHQTHPCGLRYHCAKSCAGETPALPGGSHPQPYSCKQPAMQGHFLAQCTKPTFVGFVTIVPSRVRARRPRSRVGVSAGDLVPASSLRCRATSSQGAPNPPLQGSLPLCQVVCGRDARAPGWASPPATLFVQAACGSGPLPRKAHQTGLCSVRYHCAKSCAGETPALPGGCLRPQAHSCKQPPIRGQPLGGKTLAIALSRSISDWV